MITQIDHIDLRVPSLEDAEAFFTKLGLTVIRRHSGARRSIEMTLPGTGRPFFEIREATVEHSTVDHIAFAAAPEFVDELVADGVTFTGTHREVADTGRHVSNLLDPSGCKWQIAETHT